MFDDLERVREPRYFQQTRDITQVAAPSSTTAHLMVYLEYLLAQGQTQGSDPRAHQQSLTIVPFGNTCEVDAVSPEVAMGGLQDKDVYNQGDIKWIQCKINTTVIYHLLVHIYSIELSIRSNTVVQ
jgi:hypothetical protein